MRFIKINLLRQLLVPLSGQGFVKKLAYVWKLGWKENPVMTASVLTIPIAALSLICHNMFMSKETRIRKYNRTLTIYRPDDPRVHTIQEYSIIDKKGFGLRE